MLKKQFFIGMGLGLLILLGFVVGLGIAQESPGNDTYTTGYFKFTLTELEKSLIIAEHPFVIEILEQNSTTAFVLNQTRIDERPDLESKLQNYVNSRRPVYDRIGNAYDCEPQFVPQTGQYAIICQPRS
jgi:hypothetical protein